MASSDVPEHAPYRINVEKVAHFRIAVAKGSGGSTEKIVEECNTAFAKEKALGTQVDSLDNFIQQADEEMETMLEYIALRLWET